MLERILVPLDGSEIAEAVLGQACRLLRLKDAEVLLFEAVPVPVQPGLEYAPLLADLKTEAERYVGALSKQLVGEGVRARGIVRVGGEAAGVLDVAKEEKATLIAMATHGRTGMSRFVFGSVAEKVLRASDVPVLLVRSYRAAAVGADRTPVQEIPFRKILFPVDGSETSLAILPQIRDFAKSVGAAVIVLGVVEPQSQGKTGHGEPLVRLATKALAEAGVPVDPVVRLGDPASEILDASKRHDVDLIAMSTHGRSGVSRWVFGSVTEKVLRGATVPLLVLRAKAPAK
ncbi:MAG: universal stress protein [Planctomycetes bacterium]|nr:universal stress protein [Planctomycetota bacterium]